MCTDTAGHHNPEADALGTQLTTPSQPRAHPITQPDVLSHSATLRNLAFKIQNRQFMSSPTSPSPLTLSLDSAGVASLCGSKSLFYSALNFDLQ